MRHLLCALLATARSGLRPQRELAIENLALRQQLAILKRTTKRPKLSHADRAFWVALSRLWPDVSIDFFSLCQRPRFASSTCSSCSSMSAEVCHPRPRQDLWRELRSSSACDGNRAGPHRAAVAVAEPVLRARQRSSLSQWSAGCIIATHDAQPKRTSRSHKEHRIRELRRGALQNASPFDKICISKDVGLFAGGT